ncbi:FAD binding domain-containing protein [Albimonas pacifica]|uniref:Carbon-monoxide dehydrogenase medium subunit n=1 Tax=Albimonas pacifica TaxID=1114924 RepID=A0A1I3M0M5_9RHOB|nr:xanthine dehydrogenase family protein subunit M [Albimonas pacifica]SFI90285.1 carbon-monoxide dehydrogenase medium subunit [Albimonas pacifica]
MKPAPFILHRPGSVAEAVSLLAATAEEGGLILAGGQTLTPMMALRVAFPPDVIDINAIPGLDRVEEAEGALRIGAAARHTAFRRPVTANPLGALLSDVCRHIAHVPIRERGTFCGSLCHSDPASEWCLVAAALDASLHLEGPEGPRDVAAADWFEGPMTTAREPEEMLTAVSLPLLAPAARHGFYEFNRRAGDFALGMALAVVTLDGGLMKDVRLGLGAVEDRPRRLAQAEAMLEGQPPSEALFAEVAEAVMPGLDPMGDPATPADYRRDLAGTAIRRALAAALTAQSPA